MHYVGTDGALNGSYKELKVLADSLVMSVYELRQKYSDFSNELNNNREAILQYKTSIEESQSDNIAALGAVESLSEGLDQLDKIYADIINGEDFDFSSILNSDDFKSSFSSLGDAYTDLPTNKYTISSHATTQINVESKQGLHYNAKADHQKIM